MNTNKIDVLCDQVIDVALVVKETNEFINSSKVLKTYPQRFVDRINSVLQYCYNMFINANASKHTEEQINDLMINLMNTLVKYKNSYYPLTYGYKVMNSLLDIVKDSFIELNK
jgi:hypothetical protein